MRGMGGEDFLERCGIEFLMEDDGKGILHSCLHERI